MSFSNTTSARLERAKERMKIWIEALPETLRPEAEAALDHMMLTAKGEITEAYGDGYRVRKDEIICRDYLAKSKEK